MTACASAPAIQAGPHITVIPGSELPAPGGAAGEGAYRVGPFDKLQINVFDVPDLNVTVQVDAGGHISLPLAGSIEAGGKTAEELATEIEGRLRGRYVRNPHASVNLSETVNHLMTVDGDVKQPGQYPALGGMTLMRAIATAQGVTEFARLQDVVVFRTAEGRDMVALYNLGAIRRGTYPDPRIYANDVVVVGDSAGRRLFRDILQSSSILVAPLVALLQRAP